MTRIIFSPQAGIDLEEIGDFIARDNPLRALTFIRELRSKCLQIGDAAHIGKSRPELGDGIRHISHGRYLIFYRESESAVCIERVCTAHTTLPAKISTWKTNELAMAPGTRTRDGSIVDVPPVCCFWRARLCEIYESVDVRYV